MSKIEEWDRGKKKPEEDEHKDLMVIDGLDEIEEQYMNEFELVYKKDREGNKDLNKLALEELKRTQYLFHYLRTTKKLYLLQ